MTPESTVPTDVLERFRRRVTACGGLPTLPVVAAEVIRLTHDPHSSMRDIAKIISRDPPLAARLLKVANSAFYGLTQQVGSLSVALALLGMKNITNIVTSISIFRTMKIGEDVGSFTRRSFWEHAGACGKACELVGRVCHLDLGGEGFVAGLIHDSGKIMLDAVFHGEFVRTLKLAADERLPMHVAETAIVGVDHARIGSWLAQTWHLPETIMEALAAHHQEPCDPATRPLAAALQLADAIVRQEHLGFPGFAPPPSRQEVAAWPLLAGKDFPWDDVAQKMQAEFEGVQEFLQAADQ
jgi:HD-like signal output (HDOD) protein